MALRDDIRALTPQLRRYARALSTGSAAPSAAADEVVHATLVRALGARQIGSSADLAVRLFATVTQLHRDMAAAGRQAQAAGSNRPALVVGQSVGRGAADSPARQSRLATGLMSLPLEEREALLLVALEGFDHAEAARILRTSRSALLARLTNARTMLDAHLHSAAAPASRPARNTPHLRVVK